MIQRLNSAYQTNVSTHLQELLAMATGTNLNSSTSSFHTSFPMATPTLLNQSSMTSLPANSLMLTKTVSEEQRFAAEQPKLSEYKPIEENKDMSNMLPNAVPYFQTELSYSQDTLPALPPIPLSSGSYILQNTSYINEMDHQVGSSYDSSNDESTIDSIHVITTNFGFPAFNASNQLIGFYQHDESASYIVFMPLN
jgi:hypothetical protein